MMRFIAPMNDPEKVLLFDKSLNNGFCSIIEIFSDSECLFINLGFDTSTTQIQ